MRRRCLNFISVRSPYDALLKVKQNLKTLERAIDTVLDQSQLEELQGEALIEHAQRQ